MTRKGTSAAILLAMVVLASCGRREEPAPVEGVPPKDAPSVPAGTALPASAMRVRWSSPSMPSRLTAGELQPVTVTFTNTGDATWPDKATADPKEKSGAYAVRLCYSLLPARKHVAGSRHLGERVDLTKPVAAGESVTLEVKVLVPEEPGDYVLVFELVQELVAWFADVGAEVLTLPVKVAAAGGAGDVTSLA